MWKYKFLFLTAYLFSTHLWAAKRNFDLEIHNVTCTKSEDVIKRFDCNCKMISKGRFSSNLFLMLSRTLDKRAELHLLATFIPNKGVKSIKFMDIKLNICTILSQVSRVPLIKNLMAEVRRKGNLPYECPVKGAAKKNFDLELYNVSCEKFDNVVKRFDCNTTRIAKGHYTTDMFFLLARTLDKNAELKFVLHFIPEKGLKSVKFVDMKVNICDAFGQATRVPLIKSIMEEVRSKSNLPFECPIKGDHLYSMLKFITNSSLLPPYAPFLVFNYTLAIFEENKKIASIRTRGAIVP
uniref:Uncharacterized protein n=1 Tax=Stomoxys calcitrans TaxID=35570 RepID=A0A1I8P6Q0_STOCA